MSNVSLADRHNASIIGNYGKMPVALVRGAGSRIWDADGQSYIDLFAGFGGTVLGHAHPGLVKAITEQAQTLWTVGNQFYTEPQIRLAEHLNAKAFKGQAFFCHSGAEANEAALKLARLAAGANDENGGKKNKIISCFNCFHGRTMGALSATPGPYQKGFGPMVPGHVYVPYNDLAAMDAAMDDQVAGVIMEPIQGEGGMYIPTAEYMQGVRKLCDQRNVSLIFDEVWTGVGRTGKYFGHQYFGVTPDIMSLGKALGGGVPVAGILAKAEKAAFFKPGTHGCTLGGNPVCAAVGAAVFDAIEKENLLAHVNQMHEVAMGTMRNFKNPHGRIKDIRGKGLFLGIELSVDGSSLPLAALKKGVILNVTHKTVIRICPAITIGKEELLEGLEQVEDAINSLA